MCVLEDEERRGVERSCDTLVSERERDRELYTEREDEVALNNEEYRVLHERVIGVILLCLYCEGRHT